MVQYPVWGRHPSCPWDSFSQTPEILCFMEAALKIGLLMSMIIAALLHLETNMQTIHVIIPLGKITGDKAGEVLLISW